MVECGKTQKYFQKGTTTKENMKPTLPINMDKYVGYSKRKIGAKRVKKKLNFNNFICLLQMLEFSFKLNY